MPNPMCPRCGGLTYWIEEDDYDEDGRRGTCGWLKCYICSRDLPMTPLYYGTKTEVRS